MVRWNAEGEDAAALASAILQGTLSDDVNSFNSFFDPGGPGADIAAKYSYHKPQGKRNLKGNFKKLFRKINIWKTGKEDPNTGHRE